MTDTIDANTVIAVLLLGLVSGMSTLVGVGFALWLGDNARAVTTGLGFSTGIMILIALVELVPEALSISGAGAALLSLGLGAGTVTALHYVIPHVHLFDEARAASGLMVRSGLLVTFGLVLHDVPEGFAMANSFVASPSVGIVVAVAITLHNIPEEFAIAVPVLAVRSRRLLFGSAFVSGLAEPLGAVLGLVAVSMAASLNGMFLAYAAGAMLFVSIHELVPMARRYGHLGWFAAGALVSVPAFLLLRLLLP